MFAICINRFSAEYHRSFNIATYKNYSVTVLVGAFYNLTEGSEGVLKSLFTFDV